MQPFTTRPEIRGTFGVATSTHWIASAVGLAMLERGGNAFDAAVAMGFVLQIVEPHLNGPAGDMPALFHSVATGRTQVLCAQGTAPAAATIPAFRALGLDRVPGSGLLATVVPGAFDGWLLMLRDHGSLELADVLAPAIDYARDGHPLLPAVSSTIAGLRDFFLAEWPSSAAIWCPNGDVPQPHALFRNPQLAATYTRIVHDSRGPTREARIDAARAIWSRGFVAEAIGDWLGSACVADATGRRNRALLDAADMASWQASYEEPVTIDYHGWSLHKTGPWGQGPVLLQALQILRHTAVAEMDPMGPDFVHCVIEAIKLAYADREAYYGDPAFAEIPLETLLSDAYGAQRAALIDPACASHEQRPGRLAGFEAWADAVLARAEEKLGIEISPHTGEPTMAHLTDRRGDTVHLDVIDRWGNIVAATPSGGWLQSSPVVPGLGFSLNSRAQMFWLSEGLPSSLGPGRRPRTTLTPTLASRDGRPALAFGSPGGDQQDQWQLIWFLRFVHHGMGLQEAIDAPLFHSLHFQSSFHPREAQPGEMIIEADFGDHVIEDLRRRGHRVTVAAPRTVGRLTAALREPDGILRAAATPRLMQAYAVGR